MRILSTIVLLIILYATSLAQGERPTLIYEFGEFPCDGFRGNIDILLGELSENPGWDGIVVNIGQGHGELSAVVREEMIRSHAAFRGFDASRLRYERLTDQEFKTRFLRIPADQGQRASSSRNYALTSIVAPVVLEDYDFDALCPPISYSELFGTILDHNPSSRATILVRGKSRKDARRKLQEVSTYLTSHRRISAERIRFLLIEKPDFNYGNDPVVEYRYIP